MAFRSLWHIVVHRCASSRPSRRQRARRRHRTARRAERRRCTRHSRVTHRRGASSSADGCHGNTAVAARHLGEQPRLVTTHAASLRHSADETHGRRRVETRADDAHTLPPAALLVLLELCADANRLLLCVDTAASASRHVNTLRDEQRRRGVLAVQLRERLLAAEATADMSARYGGIDLGPISPLRPATTQARTPSSAAAEASVADQTSALEALQDNDTIDATTLGTPRPVRLALSSIAEPRIVTLQINYR